MKITIGGQDYTPALDAVRPLTIERKLNEPSICQFWITMPADGKLPLPIRNQAVRIVASDGTIYFTGYVAEAPVPEYVGLGLEGPRYRFEVRAISDEHLLDQFGMGASVGVVGLDAGELMASLVRKTGSSGLSSQNLSLAIPASRFDQKPGSSFSANAAQIANAAHAAYRAVDGRLSIASIPTAVHSLNECDGSLSLANLSLNGAGRRWVANDITVCGEHEPGDYVTEFFEGDGITNQFYLSERPYTSPSSWATIIRELFNEAELDARVWANTGVQGYLSLGAGGLAMQGGTGRDGDVQLTSINPVEMGGTLLLEAGGVVLRSGSSGIIAAFFTGDATESACTAGFQVTAEQGSGAVSVQALVMGNSVGSLYSIDPANQYTFRLRVHCGECERRLAIYRSFGETAAGGQSNMAPARLLFEVQEFVNGVAGMPVILYDGQILDLPESCSVAAASSINLQGSIRSFELTDLGPGWVVTTPRGGNPTTRRVGSPLHSAECRFEGGRAVIFYPGFAPPAGELVQVSYRAVHRAVGRVVNTEQQQALLRNGLPAIAGWIGSVSSPAARSSRDCRNAALALSQAAGNANGSLSGRYSCSSTSLDSDVWPGDAIEINAPSAALNGQLIVRAVRLAYASSDPEIVQYEIDFANDWAEDLAIKTSASVPEDAWLPAAISPEYSANLSGLAVVEISGSVVTIDTGAIAPIGGGFEVRRRDNCFMPGTDPELVLRGSQPTMSVIRGSASDRFYIRAFDGATPPNYSEFSAVLIFNTPLTT